MSKIPLPDGNIHRIKGELSPAEASKDYSILLKEFAAPTLDFPRFDLVYHLNSFKNNQRLRVKLGVPDEELDVPTMSELWKSALWLEREAFEMFGFNFTGHPDLRRLLLPDVFDGFPLRKDYPLRGRGERDVILDLK